MQQNIKVGISPPCVSFSYILAMFLWLPKFSRACFVYLQISPTLHVASPVIPGSRSDLIFDLRCGHLRFLPDIMGYYCIPNVLQKLYSTFQYGNDLRLNSTASRLRPTEPSICRVVCRSPRKRTPNSLEFDLSGLECKTRPFLNLLYRNGLPIMRLTCRATPGRINSEPLWLFPGAVGSARGRH